MSGIPNRMLPVAVEMLPEGYRRSEYLESTGTQWIDTGVYLSSESEVTCDAVFNQAELNQALWGVYYLPTFRVVYGEQTKSLVIYGGVQNNVLARVAMAYGERIKMEVSASKATVNGKEFHYSAGEFETNLAGLLFSATGLSNGYRATACIYSFSISRNGQLQLNFIPCLDDKGVPCMFDTVTRRPFRNAATTGPDFLYG